MKMENLGRKKTRKSGKKTTGINENPCTIVSVKYQMKEEKRCTSSSQLDKRKRKKKSRLSKRFSIKVWLTRGAHACGGEESSLDDVLEGLQWLDACVRVQVHVPGAVAETGAMWGCIFGAEAGAAELRTANCWGDLFYLVCLVPCVSGGKAIWVAGGSQLRGRNSNKIPDQMLP